MPAISAIGNTAVQLTSNSTGNTGFSYIYIKADAGNSNTIYAGLANTVTLPLANGNTTGDSTVGWPVAAGGERTISAGQFKRVYGEAQKPDASKVWVIATAVNQRVYYEVH
jgi:hypothetical protein